MAAQMARLLTRSDADELGAIVERWVHEAPTERIRQTYRAFGARLVELRQAIAETGVQPAEAELAQTLTMMLKLAAPSGQGAPR